MKQFIEAKATKIEEKKDPETGAITYRVVLEIIENLTVELPRFSGHISALAVGVQYAKNKSGLCA